nr:MarR family winged helix-turn-helix transcriptional regulator [Goodfellowiella coeruleoviolacea]
MHAGQELLMTHLWDNGPQPQGELNRLLGLDASTVTRMVQRLENAGFVRRRRSASDRRAVLVEPTPAGLALRDQVADTWRELEETTLAGLDGADRQAVARLLERIEANLSGPDGDQPGA